MPPVNLWDYNVSPMTRLSVSPIKQPNNRTCGPVSLKIALRILGQDKPLTQLISLCQTNSNGTSTNHMIRAIEKLHLEVLSFKKSTLSHIKRFLNKMSYPCVILVSYLYDLDESGEPNPESGHWAVVRTFDAKRNRIQLLDSVSGTRKSYDWNDFLRRWLGYDLKRYCFGSRKKHFKLVKRWQSRHMLVVSNSC